MNVQVINIKNYEDDDYVYIGRPSKYGNPYSSKNSNIAEEIVETKDEAIRKFREYLNNNPQLVTDLIEELKETGHTKLGCWCKPSKCHGDVYIEKINERRFSLPI